MKTKNLPEALYVCFFLEYSYCDLLVPYISQQKQCL